MTLDEKERFEWMDEFEQVFLKLKVFLALSSILMCPRLGSLLYLYLSITDHELNLILIQETNKVE